tara:strand:+ start:529 stop:684 length:156 start_codon:yes stop_codon:yes gene_type:complete
MGGRLNNADKEAIDRIEIQNIICFRRKDLDIRDKNISSNTLDLYYLIIHIE